MAANNGAATPTSCAHQLPTIRNKLTDTQRYSARVNQINPIISLRFLFVLRQVLVQSSVKGNSSYNHFIISYKYPFILKLSNCFRSSKRFNCVGNINKFKCYFQIFRWTFLAICEKNEFTLPLIVCEKKRESQKLCCVTRD